MGYTSEGGGWGFGGVIHFCSFPNCKRNKWWRIFKGKWHWRKASSAWVRVCSEHAKVFDSMSEQEQKEFWHEALNRF